MVLHLRRHLSIKPHLRLRNRLLQLGCRKKNKPTLHSFTGMMHLGCRSYTKHLRRRQKAPRQSWSRQARLPRHHRRQNLNRQVHGLTWLVAHRLPIKVPHRLPIKVQVHGLLQVVQSVLQESCRQSMQESCRESMHGLRLLPRQGWMPRHRLHRRQKLLRMLHSQPAVLLNQSNFRCLVDGLAHPHRLPRGPWMVKVHGLLEVFPLQQRQPVLKESCLRLLRRLLQSTHR